MKRPALFDFLLSMVDGIADFLVIHNLSARYVFIKCYLLNSSFKDIYNNALSIS